MRQLFRGHNNLILALNTFLPDGYKIGLEDIREAEEAERAAKRARRKAAQAEATRRRQSSLSLIAAVRADDLAEFEQALAAGAPVESTGLPGKTWGTAPVPALMLAITLGRNRIAKLLLELGADAHWQHPTRGETAMHACAYFGNVEMARQLATLGANLETLSDLPRGATPVWIAAEKGHTEMVRLLLAQLGASIVTLGRHGTTPVWIAASGGHVEMVRLLAELGASIVTPNMYSATPVWIAAKKGHVEVVRLLAQLGASIVTLAANGHTPLSASANCNRIEATKALLLLGAPITIEDLKQYSDNEGDTRQLRADLQAWAADALVQHRIFTSTFLFGCSAHPSASTQQTTTVIPLNQPNSQTGTHTSQSPTTRFDDAATGTWFTTSSVTTITPTEVTTVTTHTRMSNPHLPTIAGMPGVLERIAAFAGIVVGKELRRTRAVGPAIAAINWAAHDQRRTGVVT